MSPARYSFFSFPCRWHLGLRKHSWAIFFCQDGLFIPHRGHSQGDAHQQSSGAGLGPELLQVAHSLRLPVKQCLGSHRETGAVAHDCCLSSLPSLAVCLPAPIFSCLPLCLQPITTFLFLSLSDSRTLGLSCPPLCPTACCYFCLSLTACLSSPGPPGLY